MFRKMFSLGVMGTAVVLVLTATPNAAHARGRGHSGGSRYRLYHGGYHNNGHDRARTYFPNYGLDYENPYDAGANPYFGPSTAASPPLTPSSGITDPATFSTFTYTPPPGTLTAVYPPVDSAAITVKTPANSQIWFDGTPMAPGGTVRKYFSQSLTPGHKYVYEIQVRWNHNGHEVTQSKKVEVSAGARVKVDFGAKSQSAG
jgi:uncharacterized protein (TIGR03000 family)